MSSLMCVVVHDVAPATMPETLVLTESLDRLGMGPLTLLAVPRYHDGPRNRRFEDWLCRRAGGGDEIALHGYTHQDLSQTRNLVDFVRRRIYTRSEGEFCDLGFGESMRRLTAGRRWLEELGIFPRGFVAPAWLMGAQAWRALHCHPFDYTCTLRGIHFLPERHTLVCQSQVFSTSSSIRRGLSVAWNAGLSTMQRGSPVVRLELHPSDVRHATVNEAWQRLAVRQAHLRRMCTVAQCVDEIMASSK